MFWPLYIDPNDPRDTISKDEIVPNKFYITNTRYKDDIDGPFNSYQEADEWAYDKYASVSAKDYENDIEIKYFNGQQMIDPQQGVAETINFKEAFDMKIDELIINEDWQKVNKKDKTDGMSRKAVKAYRRENPGSKLKTAVTTKPSKLKKGSKSAKRRKSFCARMSGMKKSRASAKTKRDPNSPINKALRRWNCESVEQMQKLVMIAEQKIAMLKEAANPAQQAAIAINMKKKGQKPKAK